MFDRGGINFEALDSAAPGPELAAILARIDIESVNGYARVIVMQAWERQSSWCVERMYTAMAGVARSPMCGPDSAVETLPTFTEFASTEVGAALRLSPRSADRELSYAYEFSERLPLTRAALAAGQISADIARLIADETGCLSSELAGKAEALIIDAAAGGLTRAQITRRLRRKVLALDPDGAEQRRQEAQQDRRVHFGAGGNGVGYVVGQDLPMDSTAAARAYVQGLAKRLSEAGDERTQGQIEADAQSAPRSWKFGMPAEDDGSLGDPLLSDRSRAVSGYHPDVGDEFGYAGQPAAFAQTARTPRRGLTP